jgi:hypothetical protein
LTGGWIRRGVVLEPSDVPWAASHAALPAVEAGSASEPALYFSPRDAEGRAHIARAPLALRDGELSVGPVEPAPLLGPGPVGSFDDSGVTMSCVVRDGARLWLFYTGWTLARTVPFLFFAGAAVSEDGGRSFARVSPAPLLERSRHDPYLTASPFVLLEDGLWRMWYVSCVGWELVGEAVRHRYLIKYAESRDGFEWRRDGRVCIDFVDEREYAISRPCVIRARGGYRMWFASRGDTYRIHSASSSDGLSWTRGGEELSPSEDGWDDEMTAYPFVLRDDATEVMLYNGNEYGATGVGWAVRPAVS